MSYESFSPENFKPANNGDGNGGVTPYVPSSQSLPEITLKAFILSIFLSILMSAANAYLGLKVGMTVSACIPAAVISMAVLKIFSRTNILENNIVQTAASAGETVAAGVIFTLPALIMMGYWDHFPFMTTAALSAIGGVLGVLISVPLRRALIIGEKMKFPEGIATAEVLKAGDKGSSEDVKILISGGFWAALVKFLQSGVQLFSESFHVWFKGAGTVFGIGTGFSGAMFGAGYIIGFHACVGVLLGGILAWVVAVPLLGFINGLPADAAEPYGAAVAIWNSKVRMIGVGTMVVGGILTIFGLMRPIAQGIKQSLQALKTAKENADHVIPRVEKDIPITYVFMGSLFMTLPVFFVFQQVMGQELSFLSGGTQFLTLVVIVVFSLISAFLCSSIAGYMAGLLGTSNNPISGVTIMAVLLTSLTLLLMLGSHINFGADQASSLTVAGITIMIGCIVCCAAALGADNLQDLKSGQLVGATPWKQQVILLVGVLAAAFSIAPVLQLLFEAYGIGDIMPREGMDPSQTLAAPKAALMGTIAKGVLTRSLDWTMFSIGAVLGFIIFAIDAYLKNNTTNWRLPTLGVAVGIYMPLDVTGPIFIGGLISYFVNRSINKQRSTLGVNFERGASLAHRRGLLFAAGLIAGEALIGIGLAVPFSFYQSTDVFKWVPEALQPATGLLGTAAGALLAYLFYKVATNTRQKA